MMLATIISFVVGFFRLALGASVGTSPTVSSCPGTIAGLQTNPHFECTPSIDWVGDGFNVEDCAAAIQSLYNVEVRKHGNTDFEFLLPGAIPYTSNPVMRTPRRYSVGQSWLRSCRPDPSR